PHRAFLQTEGVADAPRDLFELAEQLGRAGVTRICALGQMTSPEAGWHHDGRFSLLDLVQMVDIDSSAEAAAETLAPYVD
ncbi:MAG: acyl-CoA reductase, partial [Polaromonas sp.]|nr:acyl-CoA reductase [Polaromonas sp.]